MGAAEGDWLATAHGFLPLTALVEIDAVEPDPAAVAEALIGTAYVWGGRTAQGIACSGLVQRPWRAAGRKLPPDRDLQLAAPRPGPDVDTGHLRLGDQVLLSGRRTD